MKDLSSYRPWNGPAAGTTAAHLDAQADRFWALARDCLRWGLSDEAGETRRRAIALRAAAVMRQAEAFAEETSRAAPGPSPRSQP